MSKLFYLLIGILLLSCTEAAKEDSEEKSIGSDLNNIETVTSIEFYSKDSLKITADYYPNKSARSLIILFHQAEFSRGEYVTIAPELVESGYACLAVDLRSGRAARGVINETFTRAVKEGLPTKFINARQDVKAAITYAKEHSTKQIILWGSSFSASYVLMEGKKDSRVTKIVAFSPGEYFSNQNTVKSSIIGYEKPVFVACTKNEKNVLSGVIQVLPDNYTIKYQEAMDHGSKCLWPEKPGSDSLLMKVVKFLQ